MKKGKKKKEERRKKQEKEITYLLPHLLHRKWPQNWHVCTPSTINFAQRGRRGRRGRRKNEDRERKHTCCHNGYIGNYKFGNHLQSILPKEETRIKNNKEEEEEEEEEEEKRKKQEKAITYLLPHLLHRKWPQNWHACTPSTINFAQRGNKNKE